MNVFPLILYCTFLGMALFMSFLKYKSVNVVVVCLGLYFISSLTSIYYYNNAFYSYKLRLVPFLYVFGCLLITMLPVFKYENAANKQLYTNKEIRQVVVYCMLFFSLLSIEPFLENLLHLPSVLHNQSNLADIYNIRAEGDTNKNEYLSFFGRKFFYINFLLRDLVPIVLFYYIATWERLDKRLLLGLSVAILNPILHGFALGGRSTIVNSAFYLIFVYFLFRPYISKLRCKILDRLLICSVAGVGAAIALITIIRFNSDEHNIDIWTWVSLYTGEGVLNFCSDLWPVEKTSNGDSTFLFVRYILGLTNKYDIESVRATRDILGVRTNVFYTYLGTIYYDFNKTGTVVFICIFSWLLCCLTKIRNSVVRLSELIYLSILGKIIMIGVMFYPYTLWGDQLSLFFVLMFTWLLSYKESHYVSNKIRRW